LQLFPRLVADRLLIKKIFYLNMDIKISGEVLNISNCINWVMSEACGGINIFIGTVRKQTKGKTVTRLEFEAYETMALSEMHKIARHAFKEYKVDKILIHHRTGILFPGDIPVIIVVAAGHRDAAFKACRYIIDTLKKTVPIWKKEVFEDGEVWVAAHP
jgi:molybdopterin synthase catalytic subunit